MKLIEKLASREFAREAMSIVCVLVCLFALLGLSTYDPADLGANAVPANAMVANGGGILGARLAATLFGLFGLSAYLLVGLCLTWSTITFLRRDVKDILVKILGISLFVVAASILFSLRTEARTFGWADRTPSYGGILGDAAAAWLVLRFGSTGVYLLVLAIMAISFLLATDLFFYSLLRGWIGRMREWIPTLLPRRASLAALSPTPAPAAAPASAPGGLGLGGSGVALRMPSWLQRKDDLAPSPSALAPASSGAVLAPPELENPRPAPELEEEQEPPVLDDLGRPVGGGEVVDVRALSGRAPAPKPAPTPGVDERKAELEAERKRIQEERERLAAELARVRAAATQAQEAIEAERVRREAAENALQEAQAREKEEKEKRARARARRRQSRATETSAKPAAPAAAPAVAAGPAAPAPAAPEASSTHSGSAGEARRAATGTREGSSDELTLPTPELLDVPEHADTPGIDAGLREKAATLIETLRTFKIECELANIDRGPVITMFEIALAPGIKVQRVAGLADNIAMALKAPSVRIVAPIPGKSTVGIEVPNLERMPVKLREIAEHPNFQDHASGIPVILGKEATGAPLVADLTKMPHLLIAGQTGAGKSVCINSLLLSILMSRQPSEVRLLLVDPKQVELSFYSEVPHLMLPVVTDMKSAARILDWAVQEMEERYDVLSKVGTRSLLGFNKLGPEKVRERLQAKGVDTATVAKWSKPMPYVVIVIDELADLMMVAAKEVEAQITRLAQKSRAIGIHLILATQRPSVDVITGLIKANVPCRISFQVACKIDSRTILDGPGAEKLLGRGDMLYRAPGSSFLHRSQGAYVDEAEVQRVVEFLAEQGGGPEFDEELSAMAEGASSTGGGSGGDPSERDALYEDAVRVILENQRGSVSLLQRKLQIGYTRAAKLIDFMQEDGIVGEPNGSKAREINMTLEEWESRNHSAGTIAPLASDFEEEDLDDEFDSDSDEDDDFDEDYEEGDDDDEFDSEDEFDSDDDDFSDDDDDEYEDDDDELDSDDDDEFDDDLIE